LLVVGELGVGKSSSDLVSGNGVLSPNAFDQIYINQNWHTCKNAHGDCQSRGIAFFR
jgi:hypothetical protein